MHVDNCSATVTRPFTQRWVWGALAFGVAAIIVLTVAFAPFPASAVGLNDAVLEFMSTILSAIVSAVGKLLLLAIQILTLIAQYNGFVDAAAVKNGWVIVRDVANMGFIVVLLIIAFATILNVSSYQWKALLPQLVIAAILINFSKTIAGIFIDVSQVIMLTFVNGFAAAAGGNFANMFQIQNLVTMQPTSGPPKAGINLLAILGSYILAFVLITIALVTTLIMAIIMAFRIVMLWVLVVLSPLPYVLNLLPQGKKYGEKWWQMFGEYLTVGPVLAFFLWLALVSVGSGTVGSSFTGTGGVGASAEELAAARSATGALPTGAADASSLISFVIGICMLIGGLKITGEMGVIGASAAKGAVGKIQGAMKWTAKKALYYGTGAAAVRSVGTRAVQSEWAQNALGRVAAVPIVGNLALKGLGAVGAARKKREEEAAKRIAAAKGSPHELAILGRLANAPAIGADAAAVRAAARKRAPSRIKDAAERKKVVQDLKDDELLQLSKNELHDVQGDLTDSQRRAVFTKGDAGQQQAVGDLGGFDTYNEWRANQVDDETTARLLPLGAGASDADKNRARSEAAKDVARRIRMGTLKPPPPTTAPYGAARTRYSAEYNEERQQRTREKVEEYERGGKNFFDSGEFRVNATQFYPKEEYHENENTAASLRRQRESEGYEPTGVSGIRRLLQNLEQAVATETAGGTGSMPEGRLAVDFSLLGMSGNGAHLTGADKDDATQKIAGVLRQRGVGEGEIAKVADGIKRSSALNLINKGRDAGSARYTLTHESVHDQLEQIDPNQLSAMWQGIATEQRNSIVQKIREEWKDPNMSEDGAMHEYFTDGLANATRWSRAGGFRLPPEVIAQFKAMGVQFSARSK